MYYLSDFSLARSIKSELLNPNPTNTPQANPKGVILSARDKLRDSALVGTGKYVYSNKLNRRQKKSVDKFMGVLMPKQPKPNFFNPFRKPQPQSVTPPLKTNG